VCLTSPIVDRQGNLCSPDVDATLKDAKSVAATCEAGMGL